MSYTRASLEEIGKHHAPAAARHEDALCRADLLYALLSRPDAERTREVLGRVLKLLERKNGATLQHSRVWTDGRAFLESDADGDVRVFCFLMMLQREPELQLLVRRAYRPGNLWGSVEAAQERLDGFLEHLQGMAHQVLHWPVTEPNVVQTVRDFVDAAQREYMEAYH